MMESEGGHRNSLIINIRPAVIGLISFSFVRRTHSDDVTELIMESIPAVMMSQT